MTNALLTELNAFRTSEGLKPLSSWKGARTQAALDQYRAKAAATKAPKAQTKKSMVADMLVGGVTIAQISSTFAGNHQSPPH